MNINYLKEKKELFSIVLLGVSVVLAVSIVVKAAGFFTASARAANIVKTAIEQNNEDSKDIDKYFSNYKMLADALKKNNLFAPPPPKQHPVKEVTGIFGDEVIINDKLYKAGDRVGDARIVSIEPTQVTIEWDGNKKTFSPMDSGSASGPGGPGGSRATARGGEPPRPGSGGGPQMVTVQSQGRQVGPTGGPGGMGGFGFRGRPNMSEAERDRFREMQERRQRYMNMSEAERERFRAEMRERFSGGRRPGDSSGGGRRGR